ncbi:MAG TPA: aldose epimerase [Stenomitos sp.]
MDNTCLQVCNEDQTAFIEVVPARGGIITRWQVQGREILYLDKERFANPERSIRGGIPILFPICGNLPNDTYVYDDQSIPLRQHGFARDLPWQVIHHTPTSIEIALESNDLTLPYYPFDFQVKIAYQLQGPRLTLECEIANRGLVKMPFSLGFHPYFAVEDKSLVSFDIPATQMFDHLTRQHGPFNGEIPVSTSEVDAAFFPVSQTVARLKGEPTIELTYDPIFTTLVVWTLQSKPYICLEPWTAQRNALNTGIDLQWVEPHQSRHAAVTLTVLATD